MSTSRRCDDHRSLASTSYLERRAKELGNILEERINMVPAMVATLLLLVLFGAWLWGRCMLWPAMAIGTGPADIAAHSAAAAANVTNATATSNANYTAAAANATATANAANATATANAAVNASATANATANVSDATASAKTTCTRSTGSVFMMLYMFATLATAALLARAVCTVPRLRLQLEVAYRLLRADRAGGVQLPLTDVIDAVNAGNMPQAERLIRSCNGNGYGAILHPTIITWERTRR